MMNKLLGILGHELGHINQDIDSANGAKTIHASKTIIKISQNGKEF